MIPCDIFWKLHNQPLKLTNFAYSWKTRIIFELILKTISNIQQYWIPNCWMTRGKQHYKQQLVLSSRRKCFGIKSEIVFNPRIIILPLRITTLHFSERISWNLRVSWNAQLRNFLSWLYRMLSFKSNLELGRN